VPPKRSKPGEVDSLTLNDPGQFKQLEPPSLVVDGQNQDVSVIEGEATNDATAEEWLSGYIQVGDESTLQSEISQIEN
jgi:hypothetical protein